MKKIFFCVSLALAGLMAACKEEVVDADSKPGWLGESIYQELRNPDPSRLTGTFDTYLRLVDDLGLAETLDRTGSKTVFPANDEAFARFFQKNDWGVTSYGQLSDAQKKLLLYNSMLDNALLVNMLSNMSNTGNAGQATVMKGMAIKHQSNMSVIDTIQHVTRAADLPQNNKYWDRFRADGKGIYMVSDATRPMIVHFTREHMLQNNITTLGEQSDFAVLTGSPYTEGTAYVFGDRIVSPDVTCLNGYVHQMEHVIVPPGNMAQVLRRTADTQYFSRILDYFSAPYYSEGTTNDYNAWALQNGRPTIDSIFQVRYLSNQTGHNITNDPDGNLVSNSTVLAFDPGWNQYSPQQSSGGVDYAISDIGALFVPVDEAVESFFLEGGDGAYLIDIYGDKPNTKGNLNENLDSLHSKRPDILTNFMKNLMKPSFVNTVPSKFYAIQNDAQENMGMKLSLLQQTDDKYDIAIANNGVIYKINEMIAPDRYRSVMAPSSTYLDMQVMNWAVTDPEPSGSAAQLNVGFSYYLLAMSANLGFFVPDDEAFANFYVDPTSLGHQQPEALRFYYDPTARITLRCDRYAFDPATGQIGERIGEVAIARVKSLLIDILNCHTVVLGEGEIIGQDGRHYYKTKHGGEIYVDAGTTGTRVMGGLQIDGIMEPALIENIYTEKNGRTYRLDHVIQPTVNSVSKTLRSDSRFSDFYDVCAGFSASALLKWVGISDSLTAFGTTAQDAYIIFTADRGSGAARVPNSCLDENVKMFNTYNYTLYAPDNDAMAKARQAGLPTWGEIEELFNRYSELDQNSAEVEAAKAEAYAKIKVLRDFARYHFQSSSLYADNVTLPAQPYQSLSRDELGIAVDLTVSGSNGRLVITDVAGREHVVDAGDASKISNRMARDYWFNAGRTSATEIYTSSFCAVHQITDPLYVYASGRFDDAWASRQAKEQALKQYQRLRKEHKL